MIIRTEHLVILNNKNRVQHVLLQLEQDELSNTFRILRTTGQYGCKNVSQPVLSITFGKCRRSVSEQACLQFNSLLKKYLNKGYNRLSSLTSIPYNSLKEEDLSALLGNPTDTSGIPKPMLCKSFETCSLSALDRCWYCSRKLDGVRALFYYKNGEIHTASRGGKTYDAAVVHLRTNPNLITLFKTHPNLILDGEIYKHDSHFPLQKISGLCRLDVPTDECKELEYWIYDYVSNKPFKDRYNDLMEFKTILNNDPKIKILDHEYVCGAYIIRKRHDQYVQEGFEGLVMRNPEKGYGINKRSSRYMIKMKDKQSEEFTVVGVKEGLRPEDLCFILKTAENKRFAAKPIGQTEMRLEYLANAGNFIGKKATCNFFYYSNDGIPICPILVHFRPDDE